VGVNEVEGGEEMKVDVIEVKGVLKRAEVVELGNRGG